MYSDYILMTFSDLRYGDFDFYFFKMPLSSSTGSTKTAELLDLFSMEGFLVSIWSLRWIYYSCIGKFWCVQEKQPVKKAKCKHKDG